MKKIVNDKLKIVKKLERKIKILTNLMNNLKYLDESDIQIMTENSTTKKYIFMDEFYVNIDFNIKELSNRLNYEKNDIKELL